MFIYLLFNIRSLCGICVLCGNHSSLLIFYTIKNQTFVLCSYDGMDISSTLSYLIWIPWALGQVCVQVLSMELGKFHISKIHGKCMPQERIFTGVGNPYLVQGASFFLLV